MQLCNRIDNKNQHSCMSKKCCSSTIMSAGLEPMNANKFLIHTNLPKLKIRLIIALYATAVLQLKEAIHTLSINSSHLLKQQHCLT